MLALSLLYNNTLLLLKRFWSNIKNRADTILQCFCQRSTQMLKNQNKLTSSCDQTISICRQTAKRLLLSYQLSQSSRQNIFNVILNIRKNIIWIGLFLSQNHINQGSALVSQLVTRPISDRTQLTRVRLISKKTILGKKGFLLFFTPGPSQNCWNLIKVNFFTQTHNYRI